MKSLRSVIPAFVAVAAIAAFGIACGSSSSPSATVTAAPSAASSATQSSAATSTATSTAQTTATSTQSESGSGSATCDQLTNDDVQALMTNTVAGDDTSAAGTDADGQQCIFHDADSEQAIDIIVVPTSDSLAGYDGAKAAASNPVDVDGVGDAAFRDTGDFEPTAEQGGLTCNVSVGAADEIPGVTALIQNGSLDLTEAQNSVLATALGTICNRIFGSGNTTPDLSGLSTS